MRLATRIEKLEEKLLPKKRKAYFIGWQDCTWSKSEGLFRQAGESKEAFCNRVYQTTKKNSCGFIDRLTPTSAGKRFNHRIFN